MQENKGRCPGCDKKKAMKPVTRFNGRDWLGSLCKHCGHFVPEVQTKRYDLKCADCEEPIAGTKSLPYRYHESDQVWQRRHAEELGAFYCVDCHKKRRDADEPFEDNTYVRHPIGCDICGKAIMWLDVDEDTEPGKQSSILARSRGSCTGECSARAEEIAANKKALDDAAKVAAG